MIHNYFWVFIIRILFQLYFYCLFLTSVQDYIRRPFTEMI